MAVRPRLGRQAENGSESAHDAVLTIVTRIEVVAGVLEREDGSFLLAQRPPGKVYAGYWEFPGGKVEPDESPRVALARELREELGVEMEHAYPWITRDYDYEHAAVRLRFFRVTAWQGELRGRETQEVAWQQIRRINVSPLLPANGPILRALELPDVYGVSNARDIGIDVFLQQLERALERGLRLFQIREKAMHEPELSRLVHQARELASRFGAAVLLNGHATLAARLGTDGVHLTAARLMAVDQRPDLRLVAASCHNEAELARAARLQLDFVVLGPVRETQSHPGASALGWRRIRDLIADYPLPVYLIGGLRRADLENAREAGAHGIAAIRACWAE
jgi:8-oxo-dGTP diphosphatase